MVTDSNAPVELKVKVGATAAALCALLLGLGAQVLPSGAVPGWVAAPLLAVVTGAVTLGAGWLAKHTPRGVAVEVDTTPPPAAPAAPVVPPQAGPTP
jgi:protein-S-isoprenylcysteine O-methyltransferase Ste14